MAGTKIAPQRRMEDMHTAYKLSLQGRSVNSISKELGRDRGTVNRLLTEAKTLVAQELGTVEQMRAEVADKHRHLYEQAMDKFSDPAMRASTQTGPQYLKQARENLVNLTKIFGLEEPTKVDVRQHTLVEFIRSDEAQDPMQAPTWSAMMPRIRTLISAYRRAFQPSRNWPT